MTTRLFVGKLGATPRIRISKPGYDAANPATPNIGLQFDSAWPFSGGIHAMGYSASSTVSFPALPYIPFVYVIPGLRNNFILGGASDNGTSLTVTPSSISYNGIIHAAHARFTYYVFRAPAYDTSVAGRVAAPCPRMLIGKRGAELGAYISRPNYDVRTCAAGHLLFSTDVLNSGVYKIVSGAVRTVLQPGGMTAYVVAKVAIPSQGFIPMIFPLISGRITNTFWLPQNGEAVSGLVGSPVYGLSYVSIEVQVAANRITLTLTHAAPVQTFYYNFIVFNQPAP